MFGITATQAGHTGKADRIQGGYRAHSHALDRWAGLGVLSPCGSILAAERLDAGKTFHPPWNLKDEIAGQLAPIYAWGGQLIVPIPRPEILSWAEMKEQVR
jgi:hypothetical protein